MTEEKINLFIALITSLASTCWMQLGKVPNPMTNKIEKELESAKFTIELLRMLKNKTQGNLTTEEEQVLISVITDLELNYAEEVKKENQSAN
ncbi:MAG: DUF1844 domain-containing protein [Elusimicrobiota bacterium]|nr:DUF1844 domain-containing protein [Endomicrobiia bacterium]MDW8165472.1 DUF1844 domain-containing protein [Elusimicrobiota bacterium]